MGPGIKQWQDSASVIAWKKDDQSGRLVINASHPEYTEEGETLEFMAAVLEYAMEGGRSIPPLKATLENGTSVDMSGPQSTVGDGQIHRFLIQLPDNVTQLVIQARNLSHNVDLYLNSQCPAHSQRALYTATEEMGDSEEIVVERPEEGDWHLSVVGNHTHANGAPYLLTASWTTD
jgi:hypothetical protein